MRNSPSISAEEWLTMTAHVNFWLPSAQNYVQINMRIQVLKTGTCWPAIPVKLIISRFTKRLLPQKMRWRVTKIPNIVF